MLGLQSRPLAAVGTECGLAGGWEGAASGGTGGGLQHCPGDGDGGSDGAEMAGWETRTESECNKSSSRTMRFIVSLSPNVSESEGSSLPESERRTSHSEVNIQVKKRKNSGVWTWHDALTSDTPAFPSHA